jgi:hypothetical protein
MILSTTKGQKMYEDYDWDDRDELSGHHAAGAAEARAEEEWDEDEEDSDLPWPNYNPADNYNY